MSRTIVALLVFVGCLAGAPIARAADKRPGAFITAPREGAMVGRTSSFSGKTFLRGQPLALVRAVDGNGHWWVQRGIQRNDRGQLKGTIQFGNDLAEPGTRFAFVIVVAQTPLELEFFTKRESLAELPVNVPKSEIRNVVLFNPDNKPGDKKTGDRKPGDKKTGDNKPDDRKPGDNKPEPKPGEKPSVPPANKTEPTPAGTPAPDPDRKPPIGDKGRPMKFGLAILKPLENANVQRIEELVGRMESEDTPVVLVRAEGDDGQWWVQDKVVFGDGKYFKTKLRFGNDKTPTGTRFVVLVVSPRTGVEASALKVGQAFSQLPRGIRRSKEITVQLATPTSPVGTR